MSRKILNYSIFILLKSTRLKKSKNKNGGMEDWTRSDFFSSNSLKVSLIKTVKNF